MRYDSGARDRPCVRCPGDRAARRRSVELGRAFEQLLDLDVLAEAELEDQIAAGPQLPAALAPTRRVMSVEAVAAAEQRDAPARSRGPPAAGPARARSTTYGGFATIGSNGRRSMPPEQIAGAETDAVGRRRDDPRSAAPRPAPPARCRWRRRSRPAVRAQARRPRSRMPVQTSAIVSGASRSGNSSSTASTISSVSGPGNEHVRGDLERQAPELAASDDVGERLAGGAAGDERVVLLGKAVGFRAAGVA